MIEAFLSARLSIPYLFHLQLLLNCTDCWQSLWCRGIPWYLPNSICTCMYYYSIQTLARNELAKWRRRTYRYRVKCPYVVLSTHLGVFFEKTLQIDMYFLYLSLSVCLFFLCFFPLMSCFSASDTRWNGTAIYAGHLQKHCPLVSRKM
jgi:hypothetical protein